MTKITCKKCKHEWDYTGESRYYLSCSRCRHNIRHPEFKRVGTIEEE